MLAGADAAIGAGGACCEVGPGRGPDLSTVWVPVTLRTLCDVLILVDQSPDPIVSSDVVVRGGGAAAEGPQGCGLGESAVRPVMVVAVFERMQHGCGVSLVDDQETVEEFAADRRDRDPRPRPCPAGAQGVR